MDRLRQGVLGVLHRDGSVVMVRKPGRPADEWLFPGGGIDGQETVREAFFREMHEELGLTRDDLRDVAVTDETHRHPWPDPAARETDGQAKQVVVAGVAQDATLEPNAAHPGPEDEIAAVRWVDREDVVATIPFDDLTASYRAVEGVLP